MEFKVEFRACGAHWYSIAKDVAVHEIGLDHIDRARAEFGSDLSLDIFSPIIQSLYMNAVITVPEDLAREAGCFYNTNKVFVDCGDGCLNDFVDVVHVAEVDEETDVIRKISFKYVIKEKEILEKWKKDGFVLSY